MINDDSLCICTPPSEINTWKINTTKEAMSYFFVPLLSKNDNTS